MQTKITITPQKEGALYDILARMAVNHNNSKSDVSMELIMWRLTCYKAEWPINDNPEAVMNGNVIEIYEGAYCTMRMEWKEVHILNVENHSSVIVNPD